MSERAAIERVEVFPVRLPMRAVFTFASGSAGGAEGAPHVFVRVTDTEGAVGWGEGRPVPGWSYETLETVTTSLRNHLGPAAAGCPVHDLTELHRRFHAALGRGPSPGQPIARAALEMAACDCAARRAGLSLRAFFGGGIEASATALSYTVTAHEPAQAREQVAAGRAEGFRHFNFKAAVAPETDGAVGRAVRDAAGDDAFVWADANQGLAAPTARATAQRFLDAGVDVLEQPLPADRIELLRGLRAHSALPLAVDEASVGPADFFRHAAEGLVDYLVVKVTRSGGLVPSWRQIAIAEAAGLPLLVSGLTDGFLTKLAACQLAAAAGCAGPAALNGTQFVDETALFPQKGELEDAGHVALPEAPGIGTEPAGEGLERHAA